MDKHVLIIDDDRSLAIMYQEAFVAAGIACDVTNTGDEGIAKATQIKPSLILLDLMMPGKSGLEVLGLLKNNNELKDIPVVMFTNLSGDPLEQEARQKGAADFLNKSTYKPREIVEKVKNNLK